MNTIVSSTSTVKRKFSNRQFAFCIAFLTVFFLFLPFLGQKLYSDTVTFHKGGDSLQLTVPAFIHTKDFIWGSVPDLGTFNGSTEMALRSNIPVLYPPAVLLSLLGSVSSFYFAYILLFALQAFFSIYYGILLCLDFFQLRRGMACLAVLSSISVLACSSWYSGFFFTFTLLFPLLYFSIRALTSFRFSHVLPASLCYTFMSLAGYVSLAVFGVVLCFLISVLYIFLWHPLHEKPWKTFGKCLCAPVIAGIVVIPIYLQILLYTKATTMAGQSSLSIALGLYLIPQDLTAVFSSSFISKNPIESMGFACIGLAWTFIWICFFTRKDLFVSFSRKQKIFLLIFPSLFVIFLLIFMGRDLPFGAYFYSLVPVLGGMHLPIRYMQFITPLFFLASAILLQRCDTLLPRKVLKAITIAVSVLLGYTVFVGILPANIMKDRFIIELICFLTFLLCLRFGPKNLGTIAAAILCTILIPLRTIFYGGILNPKFYYDQLSIVYSPGATQAFNSFLQTLPPKEQYRFLNFDTEVVPVFVPSNFAWYETTESSLCNYAGYETHLSMPARYDKHFLGFDHFDWQYAIDTKADFIIIDPKLLDERAEEFNHYIDYTQPPTVLDNNHIIFRLQSFLPSHYTGDSFIPDSPDSLNNGYFYSPSLKQNALEQFETDKKTYFKASLNAAVPADVSFLFYPNSHYHYYYDGAEIQPILDNDVAYFSVAAGHHTLEVRYHNPFNVFSFVLLWSYCGFVLAAIIAVNTKKIFFYIKNKHKNSEVSK